MKKIIISVLICCTLLVSLLTINQSDVSDITEKKIGSDDYIFVKEEIEDIDVLLESADFIVRGHVTDKGKTVKKMMNFSQKANEKYEQLFGKEQTMSITEVDFTITEVVYSSQPLETVITLQQYGIAGEDKGETKLKPNKEVLLILKDNLDGSYSIVGLESGAFSISKDNTIVSHSNDSAVNKFDNSDMNDLLKVLKTSTKLDKKNFR